jgi:thiamine-monophosphate kinase
MACLPAAAVVSAALPRGVGVEYAKELYLGMKEAGERFGCVIVGGDTGSWGGKLALSVTIMGRSAGIKPGTRNGARPGDAIFVTGPLGGSILGRHMTFTPRVEEARALAETRKVRAMIDLSDGLSRDLAHICRESGVGAVIDAHRIPVHEDAVEMRRDGHSPLEHALHDGEDYELLFCLPSEGVDFDQIPVLPGAVFPLIGRITEEPGVRLRTAEGEVPLEPKSWEHRL